MNDFDYDALQKKRIAQGARHRKCGSKTRYVSLPHDHITRKEWEKMNGDIVGWNLAHPMNWGQFREMPQDLKKEYLTKLKEELGGNATAIAKMFGVDAGTVIANAQALGIRFKRGVKCQKGFLEFAGVETVENPVEESVEKPVEKTGMPDYPTGGHLDFVGTYEEFEPWAKLMCRGKLKIRLEWENA